MLLNPLHNLQKVAWGKAEITLPHRQHPSHLSYRAKEFRFAFEKEKERDTLTWRANFHNKGKEITVKFLSENVKNISCS